MAALMTPDQYAAKYRSMLVCTYTDEQAQTAKGGNWPADARWVRVSVKNYRLGLEKGGGAAKDAFWSKIKPHVAKNDQSITVWVKNIEGSIQSRTFHHGDLAGHAVAAFTGKANPEEMQLTLQLAVRYGVITAEEVQAYCDAEHIGLDCNGFVGNYLRHAWDGMPWDTDLGKHEKGYDANSLIKSIMMSKSVAVKDPTDLFRFPFATHLLAMTDGSGQIKDHVSGHGDNSIGHIMITEPGIPVVLPSSASNDPGMVKNHSTDTKAKLGGAYVIRLKVVESTGHKGLVTSDYDILDCDAKGVFTVFRGSQKKRLHVVIRRLN